MGTSVKAYFKIGPDILTAGTEKNTKDLRHISW